MRVPFVAGNWKMNMSAAETASFITELKDTFSAQKNNKIEIAICPPFPYLIQAARGLRGTDIKLGGQNMHWENKGAFTGEISGGMLKEAGCEYVILGHSERRQYFGETDEGVRRKILAAADIALKPIVCIGETLAQREADETDSVVCSQLEGALSGLDVNIMRMITLAYEPVWAIGTGKTASAEQAQAVHRLIREWIGGKFDKQTAALIRIQYGGSVKPENAGELVSKDDIDGALVGGASLSASSFQKIAEAVITITG
jgi:triosephosphate isomerase